tara:strand:- start:2700 stop:3536 length:837 start_codon:yes stop_codon:yes gene_type:complete
MNIDAIEFIKNLYNDYDGIEDTIEKGCCVSSRKSFKGTYWESYNKVHKWKCNHHKIFYISMIQKYLADVVHPINLANIQNNILTLEQQNKIKELVNSNIKKCPLCPLLYDKPDNIKPYYRLPVQSGTIIMFGPTIDPAIVDYNITNEEPVLIDTTGYRGTGLYVIHSKGITNVNCENYYPIWDIYKDFITPKVIKSFHNCVDGFIVNSNIMFSFIDNKWCDISDNNKLYDCDNYTVKDITNDVITINYNKNKSVILSKDICILKQGDNMVDMMKLNES